MSEAVVNDFEMIEIDEDHGRSPLGSTGEHQVEPCGEMRSIRKTRERIVGGVVQELGFDAFALGDILDHADRKP